MFESCTTKMVALSAYAASCIPCGVNATLVGMLLAFEILAKTVFLNGSFLDHDNLSPFSLIVID